MLDLHLLRSFIAVAETEHVGRAAEKLHVSQSPLSRQIQRLEAELGMRLFDRIRRRIRLTAEGRWLLAESRRLLDDAERVEREAGRVARGEVGSVTVGFVRGAMWSRVLPAALRRFRAVHPDVRVALRAMTSTAQVAALRSGAIDVGVVYTAPRGAGVTVTPLAADRFVLALPRGHRLARATAVRPRDLDGQPWVALARSIHPRLSELVLGACAEAGFTPDVRYEANEPVTLLALVDAALGLALVQESARRAAPAGVKLRVLPWLDLSLTMHLLVRSSPLAARLADQILAAATFSTRQTNR